MFFNIQEYSGKKKEVSLSCDSFRSVIIIFRKLIMLRIVRTGNGASVHENVPVYALKNLEHGVFPCSQYHDRLTKSTNGIILLELKNHLLLIAKRYIYISRCKGSPLSVNVFNILLKDTARLEEIIARQKGKLEFHYKKWSAAGNVIL